MKHSVRIKLTIAMALQDKTDSHSKNHFLTFTELSLYKILSILKKKNKPRRISNSSNKSKDTDNSFSQNSKQNYETSHCDKQI